MDDVKKEIRKEQIKAGFGNPIDDDGGDSSDSDEDKYVDKMDMPGMIFLFVSYSLLQKCSSLQSRRLRKKPLGTILFMYHFLASQYMFSTENPLWHYNVLTSKYILNATYLALPLF